MGWDVGRMAVPKAVGADVGLCECMSVRKWAGSPPLLFMYEYSFWRMAFADASSAFGEIDMLR